MLGAVAYTFYLYFDFSGYSDSARAAALMMGISLPENFKTPFFASNFSGFPGTGGTSAFPPGCRITCSCRWPGRMYPR